VVTSIDVKTLQKMFLAGAKNLEANKAWINELNVFPVPDGDTGTNMTLTIMSAAKEVAAISEPDMKSLCKAMSSGSLRGARGNSGVILSQLFRGFTKEIKQYDSIDAVVISNACERAVESAYKAVMKPKEGTILTVAKGVADKVKNVVLETDDIDILLKEAIKEGNYVLSQTPEMLPVLKQAGVVDSGGQGLMSVLEGAYDAFCGKDVDVESFGEETAEKKAPKYKYEVSYIVKLSKVFDAAKENELKNVLSAMGENVRVAANSEAVKVEIKTDEPGQILSKGIAFGELVNVSVNNTFDTIEADKLNFDSSNDNSKENNSTDASSNSGSNSASSNTNSDSADNAQTDSAATAPAAKSEEMKEYGFITVSIGEGINEIFKGLGVDEIIEGGQTMNPSTEDVLNAIDKVNAKVIYIMPNNKNIILAANQAASLTEDKEIVVVPSKNVPQGITAIISFVAGNTSEENLKIMTDEMNRVKTGQITYAVRDTVIDDKVIKENDIMGIGDSGIVSVGQDIKDTTVDMLDNIIDEDSELVCIYFGQDVTEDDAKEVAKIVGEKHPDVEIEVNYGGQPIYYYVVSVE